MTGPSAAGPSSKPCRFAECYAVEHEDGTVSVQYPPGVPPLSIIKLCPLHLAQKYGSGVFKKPKSRTTGKKSRFNDDVEFLNDNPRIPSEEQFMRRGKKNG